jgi:D-glycero-D-manno-heptose 1,7-bisphosphate phosphatase
MTVKTIFLDRDGVVNKEVNYLSRIDDFEFIDGVFEACKHFQILGYSIIIITNQSGIGRGYYSENDYQVLTKWMLSKLNENNIEILDIFYCPHSPNNQCECRKPKSGMFEMARDKHAIDMKKSWSIGDKETDIEASNLSGISNTILVRSGHKIHESKSKAKYFLESIHESMKIIKS